MGRGRGAGWKGRKECRYALASEAQVFYCLIQLRTNLVYGAVYDGFLCFPVPQSMNVYE